MFLIKKPLGFLFRRPRLVVLLVTAILVSGNWGLVWEIFTSVRDYVWLWFGPGYALLAIWMVAMFVIII